MVVLAEPTIDATAVYRSISMNYPKFFKMDSLCKWAMVAAECLLKDAEDYCYASIEKTNIAMVLMTRNGCIDVDKKYWETTAAIASPALFVYTLPNIMLGEISIKHGFKGEQLTLVSNQYDKDLLQFWVSDVLQNRGMKACLAGWVDVENDKASIALDWYVQET